METRGGGRRDGREGRGLICYFSFSSAAPLSLLFCSLFNPLGLFHFGFGGPLTCSYMTYTAVLDTLY